MREILELWSERLAKGAAAEVGRKAPSLEERRKALLELKRSFQRIERDYSEAYEQCRNDAQRRALEQARQHAHGIYVRARNDDLAADSEGWRQAEKEFNEARAAFSRPLSALKTAGAVLRILKRLAMIAEQVSILAA